MGRFDYNPPFFPFTALVKQDILKLALIITSIHPGVMGVLIRGQKGTAKSTAARALARLLPPINVSGNCLCGCDPDAPIMQLCTDCRERMSENSNLDKTTASVPFVTLPANATEDNLVGSMDFEYALKSGRTCFQPGLFAKAHRGFLYVDEVNLLDDHLVDLVLDVASSGVNVVERDGISYSHPSRFVLIGTMNPEEGELRPQFLDRFGLCVTAENIKELTQRCRIIKRREGFEKNPHLFYEKWQEEEEKESRRIEKAVLLFSEVNITGKGRKTIVRICVDAGVAGHRADIVIENASKAIAAYMGRHEVESQDIRLAASMALPHRIRKHAEDESLKAKRECNTLEMSDRSERIVFHDDVDQEESHPLNNKTDLHRTRDRSVQLNLLRKDTPLEGLGDLTEKRNGNSRPSGMFESEVFAIGKPVAVSTRDIFYDHKKRVRSAGGQRNRMRTEHKRGRYIRSIMNSDARDIALDATIRAAAPYQLYRKKGNMAVRIESRDIREKVRERKTSMLLIFIVDASGSMGTRLMTESKGAIMYMLMEAYQKRDRVGMIAFKDDRSELLLPPTDSIELAKKKLENLPAGGKTPLAAGLLQGYLVALKSIHSNKSLLPLLILITDGRANVGADSLTSKNGTNVFHLFKEIFVLADLIHQEPCLESLVLDTEEKQTGKLGKAKEIAECMGAKYIALQAINSKNIAGAVSSSLGR
ncbi:MAG: magnesium chelatase subunit D family protein [Deltaproteobacteria bacterium]|nr:magnesium chelatase subunit D family protein [Deltaproteobacteria bacterium]